MNSQKWYIAECRVILRDGTVYSREALAPVDSLSAARRYIRAEFAANFGATRIKRIEFLSLARESGGPR